MAEWVLRADLARLIDKHWHGNVPTLSYQSEVPDRTIRRIRNGDAEYTSMRTADRILTALNLHVHDELEIYQDSLIHVYRKT
jgi:hypothetical protein